MARPKKLTEAEKMRDVEAYTHDDKKRTNNPPVGMAQHDKAEEKIKTYQFDPHLDPTLQWAGKAEGTSFEVPTSSIHIHESIKPHSIISHVMKEYSEALEGQLVGQQSMFEAETPAERMRRRRESIEFYQHGVNWTNRMIAGDSLVIMNSLLEKEGMAGQVQMVYIDPPYGIKYGSNFQPFVDKRDVKDKKDEDLSQEPEMIKAFRDTWELGIHSYLTYLRNRLLLARELLTDSGSVFIQISDENVHHVRELCDEIFSPQNFILQIFVKKTGGAGAPSDLLAPASVGDYIIWYAKDKKSLKYHRLFENKADAKSGINNYSNIRLPDGTERSLTPAEKKDLSLIPKGARLFGIHALTSQSGGENARFPIEYNGKTYRINSGSWKTSQEGIQNLIKADRIRATDTRIGYVRFFDDFPVVPLTNAWDDTRGDMGIIYVVQTATKIIQRCILMTTDPGDLVLDITCGSGTTAYVAEQWGRRWITCDTSRVAITLAKQRLMTATFDYYKLAHPEQGVGSGFVYKTVPHITLKSIANNEPPATETLYDQPEIDKGKVRITGPFTVEALPAPVVKPLDISHWDCDHYNLLRNISDTELSQLATAHFPNQLVSLTSLDIAKRIYKCCQKTEAIVPPRSSQRSSRLKNYCHGQRYRLYIGEARKSLNHSGTALEVHSEKECALLTADHTYKQIFEDMYPNTDKDLILNMVVPHHGGNAGQIPSPIYIYKPGIAIISTDGVSYGHPLPKVMNRLKTEGFQIYRTDVIGTNITLTL